MSGLLNLDGAVWRKHKEALYPLLHVGNVNLYTSKFHDAMTRHAEAWAAGVVAEDGILPEPEAGWSPAAAAAVSGGPDLVAASRAAGMEAVLDFAVSLDPRSAAGRELGRELTLYGKHLAGISDGVGGIFAVPLGLWRVVDCTNKIRSLVNSYVVDRFGAPTRDQATEEQVARVQAEDDSAEAKDGLRSMWLAGFGAHEMAAEVNHVHGAHKAAGFSIACMLWRLAQPCNAEWVGRLRAEWEAVLGKAPAGSKGFTNAPSRSDVKKLTLTGAVIKEVMRLHVVSLCETPPPRASSAASGGPQPSPRPAQNAARAATGVLPPPPLPPPPHALALWPPSSAWSPRDRRHRPPDWPPHHRGRGHPAARHRDRDCAAGHAHAPRPLLSAQRVLPRALAARRPRAGFGCDREPASLPPVPQRSAQVRRPAARRDGAHGGRARGPGSVRRHGERPATPGNARHLLRAGQLAQPLQQVRAPGAPALAPRDCTDPAVLLAASPCAVAGDVAAHARRPLLLHRVARRLHMRASRDRVDCLCTESAKRLRTRVCVRASMCVSVSVWLSGQRAPNVLPTNRCPGRRAACCRRGSDSRARPPIPSAAAARSLAAKGRPERRRPCHGGSFRAWGAS